MLKNKFTVASPARKPRKSARKRITKGQVRTNVVIDRELVEKAKAKARVRTAREAIHAALENYVKPYDYSGILELAGTGCLADDYDYKTASPPKYLGWDPVYKPD